MATIKQKEEKDLENFCVKNPVMGSRNSSRAHVRYRWKMVSI